MISPTIGRVVWFYPGPGFPGSRLSEQPMDAHVAYVWGERAVNLMVVDHRGCPWPVASVPLRQEGDPEPAGHWCEWMPYQTAQAKKFDADPLTAGVIGGVGVGTSKLGGVGIGSTGKLGKAG